ncbi:MAG: DNA-3-methyladenine glycosylase, partial [Blastocatellia bacterium]
IRAADLPCPYIYPATGLHRGMLALDRINQHNQGFRMAYLKSDFFARDTLEVARDLIGSALKVGQCEGRIVETEAYTTDDASHFVTRSRQAAAMRETFGHIYIYLIYGMYYCLNVTTERNGVGAVLIRAAEPVRGIDEMMNRRGTDDLKKIASGPGRLCEAFGIDLKLNGLRLGREIKIKERGYEPEISKSPRIGITRAADLDWRFYETGNPFVSRRS